MLSSGNSLVIPGALVRRGVSVRKHLGESSFSFNRLSLRPRRAERFAMVTKENRTKARITGFLPPQPICFPHTTQT